MTNDEPLLLLSEVAAYTRAPVSSVRHWVRTGQLASLKVGKRHLVKQTDLKRFLDERRVHPPKEGE
ncbi:MAG: helix-turn-helix domain-containing protein [Myxococcales bacterium]|nr:helix-turn-helix domain-containing protein [Myxococcales bacterium]